MSRHPLNIVFEHLDEPAAPDFREALRARLFADLVDHPTPTRIDTTEADANAKYRPPDAHRPTPAEGPQMTNTSPTALPSDPPEDYVKLALSASPTGSNRRMSKGRVMRIVLGVAACVALILILVVVVNRPNDDSNAAGNLHDVKAAEALPLATAAMFNADALKDGHNSVTGWTRVDDYTSEIYAQATAETKATRPECARLTSAGLLQPTTKSVNVHQDFVAGFAPMLHDVWVFATPQDATKAMDVIASDVFPPCLFSLFDDLTPLGRRAFSTSVSRSWDAPTIALHGDRQIIIGQHIDYTFTDSSARVDAINAFVQVGRAISFVDMQYFGLLDPASNVERAITASANALQNVFGG